MSVLSAEQVLEGRANCCYDVAGLFQEYHAPLQSYLSWLTRDSDIAEDAAQEAFVRLMEKPPAQGSTRAWLYTVGRNIAFDALRLRLRRDRLLAASPFRVPMGDPLPLPDAIVEAASARDWIRKALKELPEREQRILLMRAEGYSGREIAEAVGGAAGSVATTYRRALMKLGERSRARVLLAG